MLPTDHDGIDKLTQLICGVFIDSARTAGEATETNYSAHFDEWLERVRQRAIADFVGDQSARYRKHTGVAIQEDIALAIGKYDVPFEMIYNPETTTLEDLDDFTLAHIHRLRADRKRKE